MIDWSSCQAVERDPERYSGAWVFRGTRVPVAALFENLVESVLFLASHESPGLQVADLCSYAVWRLVEHSDDSLGKPLRHCFDREPVTSHLKPGHWHGVRYYGSDPAVRARLHTLWNGV